MSGSISENDLRWADVANFWSNFHTLVHESGSTYYQSRDGTVNCSKSKQETVRIINSKLSQGIILTERASYADDVPPWTAAMRCKISDNPSDGGWMIRSMTPSPPGGAVCNTSVPLKVSFGTVPLGSANLTTEISGTIKCDKNADVSLSFRGFEDAYIPVGDAKVKVAFDNGKSTYKLTAQKYVTTNFKVNFQAISTGTTTGYKSGSTVLVIEWQ